MKKDILLSAYAIDNALYLLYRKSLDFNFSEDPASAYIATIANYGLHYYIQTGRASTEFLKAFINLTDCRMNTAIKKCIKADARTEADAIRVFKAYLKV